MTSPPSDLLHPYKPNRSLRPADRLLQRVPKTRVGSGGLDPKLSRSPEGLENFSFWTLASFLNQQAARQTAAVQQFHHQMEAEQHIWLTARRWVGGSYLKRCYGNWIQQSQWVTFSWFTVRYRLFDCKHKITLSNVINLNLRRRENQLPERWASNLHRSVEDFKQNKLNRRLRLQNSS